MRGVVIVSVVLASLLVGCKENLSTNQSPGQAVTLRGEIAAGVECPMLIVEGNRRFSLTGDLGQFEHGDRVCVRGTIAEMSICQAGEATVVITAIGPEDSCP